MGLHHWRCGHLARIRIMDYTGCPKDATPQGHPELEIPLLFKEGLGVVHTSQPIVKPSIPLHGQARFILATYSQTIFRQLQPPPHQSKQALDQAISSKSEGYVNTRFLPGNVLLICRIMFNIRLFLANTFGIPIGRSFPNRAANHTCVSPSIHQT